MENENKSLEFHEVEVKFRVEEGILNDWKQLASTLEGVKDFIYVESDDVYFTKENEFIRYRFSNNKKDKRAELTYKAKTTEGNNIIRKEVNVRVDGNDKETVEAFANCLGYTKNFKITKYVHIYKFDDVTLPFYTVIDESGKRDSFIEIEVNEEQIHKLSEEDCWNIIKKYEALMMGLGITAQKRLRKSLFEMYRKGTSNAQV